MVRQFGFLLVIGGVALLTAGLMSSESIASSFSRFFTGNPTDHAMWLMLGGFMAIAAGGMLGWKRSDN